MHPELARFPSQIFYDNKIRNGEVTLNRRCCRNFPWPNHQIPTFFYCIEGVERLAANGVSYVNPEEAQAVKDVINRCVSMRNLCFVSGESRVVHALSIS